MKILVSTEQTQGKRKNDFCFVPEHEPVKFGFECDREAVDGHCGCKRSLVGMYNHKATTTFRVIETPINHDHLSNMIFESLKDSGWVTEKNRVQMGIEAIDQAKEINRIAETFRDGDVLERRGNKIQVRT